MRPKIAWRLINVVVLGASVAAGLAWGGWEAWVCAMGFAVLGAATFRSFIRVEDFVVYRRGVISYPPFDLANLSEVKLRRVLTPPGPYPHLELWLVDGGGHRMLLSLRWWSRSGRLLALVAFAASEPIDGQLGNRRWRMDLDPKTQRRLAHYA